MHLSFPLSQFCTFGEQLPVQVLFSGSERTNNKVWCGPNQTGHVQGQALLL